MSKTPRLQNKTARAFHKQATKRGWQLARHGRHLVYQQPGCSNLVVSATPSDGARALKNMEKEMLRLERDRRPAAVRRVVFGVCHFDALRHRADLCDRAVRLRALSAVAA